MMRKIISLTVLSILFTISCKKDDNTTYSQDKLNGTWESTEKDEKDCVSQLIITASSMKEKTVCSSSTFTVSYDEYSFDGKKISVKMLGISAVYLIEELTDTKLILSLKLLGTNTKAEYLKKM